MRSLMRVTAPYFFSLATILLDKKGSPDPMGATFDSPHCDIRGSVDRTTLVVLCKDIDRDNRGGIAGSRGPDGETFTGLHTRIASHMEHQVALCFPGEHVFSFGVDGPNGEAAIRHVAGLDLKEAKRWLMRVKPDVGIRDLVGIRSPEAFAADMPEGTPVIVTEALAADRAWKARLATAPLCTGDVHTISWRDPAEGDDLLVRQAAPILAKDIVDAMAFFRGFVATPAAARIVRIEVATMSEYLAAKGKTAREPLVTPALAASTR